MLSRRGHLAFLYEMFLPEARFPDEKFWNRDGTPIYPDPKGPPPGTSGKTHADLGATGAARGVRKSKTLPEFRKVIRKMVQDAFGLDPFANWPHPDSDKDAFDITHDAWNEGANEQEATERIGDALQKDNQFSDDPYYESPHAIGSTDSDGY